MSQRVDHCFPLPFRRCVTGSRLELTHFPNSLSRKCFFFWFYFFPTGYLSARLHFFQEDTSPMPAQQPPPLLSYPFVRSLYPSRSFDGASWRKKKTCAKFKPFLKGFLLFFVLLLLSKFFFFLFFFPSV